MEKLEGYSVERRLDVALQLIGTVFFAMCDGLGENAARRVTGAHFTNFLTLAWPTPRVRRNR